MPGAWLDEGAQLSAASDYPIGSYNPLDTVWGMVTRQLDELRSLQPAWTLVGGQAACGDFPGK